MAVVKGDQLYQKLLDAWISQDRPENLIVGKHHYRVYTPADDEVVFEPQEGFENYASQTRIPGSG